MVTIDIEDGELCVQSVPHNVILRFVKKNSFCTIHVSEIFLPSSQLIYSKVKKYAASSYISHNSYCQYKSQHHRSLYFIWWCCLESSIKSSSIQTILFWNALWAMLTVPNSNWREILIWKRLYYFTFEHFYLSSFQIKIFYITGAK